MDARAGATSRFTRVLITGPPGIGKTTTCKRIVSLLEQQNCSFDGFYTEEIRGNDHRRKGFDVVPLRNPEKRLPLALIQEASGNFNNLSKYKMARYWVFADEFVKAVSPIICSKADILLIDEIGKMELCSARFYDEVSNVFFGEEDKMTIVATVPELHKIQYEYRYRNFFERMHSDSRSKVFKVTYENRHRLPEEIMSFIL